MIVVYYTKVTDRQTDSLPYSIAVVCRASGGRNAT